MRLRMMARRVRGVRGALEWEIDDEGGSDF